jgi:hypothetical protein
VYRRGTTMQALVIYDTTTLGEEVAHYRARFRSAHYGFRTALTGRPASVSGFGKAPSRHPLRGRSSGDGEAAGHGG